MWEGGGVCWLKHNDERAPNRLQMLEWRPAGSGEPGMPGSSEMRHQAHGGRLNKRPPAQGRAGTDALGVGDPSVPWSPGHLYHLAEEPWPLRVQSCGDHSFISQGL